LSGRFGAGSLRLNLIAWLVAPGLVVLAVSAWLSYNSAFRLSTLVTDRQLTSSARVIAEQIGYSGGKLVAVIPPAALELFATDSHDEVAYAVMDPYEGLVAGYPGLDAPETLPVSDDGQRYFEKMFRTEAMRATMLRQPVITPQGTVVATVFVGETQ
jgi:two-component system, OmpR family, sensor histidine kinase TctE